jgi:hypothetical protein
LVSRYQSSEELGGDGGKRGVEARREGPQVAAAVRHPSTSPEISLVMVEPNRRQPAVDGQERNTSGLMRPKLGSGLYYKAEQAHIVQGPRSSGCVVVIWRRRGGGWRRPSVLVPPELLVFNLRSLDRQGNSVS